MTRDDHPLVATEDLLGVVQMVLGEEIREIIDWRQEKMADGSVGHVYQITGEAIGLTDQSRSWGLVLKHQKFWERHGDPECWRRELMMYRSGYHRSLPPGMRVPQCYKIQEGPGEYRLWLEKICGAHGEELGLTEYGRIGRSVGEYQAQWVGNTPGDPWLSSRYWLASVLMLWGSGAMSWLQMEEREILGPEMTERIWRLWGSRDALMGQLSGLPQTLCHRDLTPGNVFVNTDVILLDWDCAGIGVLGEDMADLTGEALVYYGMDPAGAPELSRLLLHQYISGLRSAGWQGEERDVHLGYAIHLALHWCLRVAFLLGRSEDVNRYLQILEALFGILDREMQ